MKLMYCRTCTIIFMLTMYFQDVTLRMKPSLITMRPDQSCMMPILIFVPGRPTVHSFTHRPQLTMLQTPALMSTFLVFDGIPQLISYTMHQKASHQLPMHSLQNVRCCKTFPRYTTLLAILPLSSSRPKYSCRNFGNNS